MRIRFRASLLIAVQAFALAGQTQFSEISDANARAAAVRAAREQLKGRTDPAAIAQWTGILTEMSLAKDPELKGVLQTLRALDLYDSREWIELVNMGYAYAGESESARQFRAELAHRLPDSSWAVQAAIEQWQATHRPSGTTESDFAQWNLARVEFLKRLHEEKPRSEEATRQYLDLAIPIQSRLPDQEALALADLALQSKSILWSDPRLQVVRIYLDHHARLDDVPDLLNEALQSRQHSLRDRIMSGSDAEAANLDLARTQLQVHCDLAEYWLQKSNREQARTAVQQASEDLARLTPAADDPSDRRALFEFQQRAVFNLAKKAEVEIEPVMLSKQIDWAKVQRMPLGEFAATDLKGRKWSLQDWKGKVVLVNLWATWCAPCRAELPYLQKLQESFGSRKDRLIVSINVDSDHDLARQFIREHGYTFPVFNSQALADQIDFAKGVPQNRLVDKQGQLLAEPVEGMGDAWLAMVKRLMDEVDHASPSRNRALRDHP